MKLVSTFLPAQIGNRYFLFPVGQATVEGRNMLELNETGYDIIQCLIEDCSIDTIVSVISQKYDAHGDEKETVYRLVSEYVTKLLEMNYLIMND